MQCGRVARGFRPAAQSGSGPAPDTGCHRPGSACRQLPAVPAGLRSDHRGPLPAHLTFPVPSQPPPHTRHRHLVPPAPVLPCQCLPACWAPDPAHLALSAVPPPPQLRASSSARGGNNNHSLEFPQSPPAPASEAASGGGGGETTATLSAFLGIAIRASRLVRLVEARASTKISASRLARLTPRPTGFRSDVEGSPRDSTRAWF
jgi:hypothetical protein